ncbi:hypothetical protein ACVIGB_000269 [Bradyrhizobium sp. USDA 4341]
MGNADPIPSLGCSTLVHNPKAFHDSSHRLLHLQGDRSDIGKIVEGLSILTTIPHARRLEVARNRKADQFGNDIDVIVYGEFDNETELAAYKAHDLCEKSIKRVRPLRKLRFAADYNV